MTSPAWRPLRAMVLFGLVASATQCTLDHPLPMASLPLVLTGGTTSDLADVPGTGGLGSGGDDFGVGSGSVAGSGGDQQEGTGGLLAFGGQAGAMP